MRAVVLVALVVASVTVPFARRALVEVWGTLDRAVAAARSLGARDRSIGTYVVRYGITWRMADAVERAARAERLEPDLAFRLVRVESGFDERAVSPVGAVGLTQIMPATARELQPGITREQLFDRDTNLRLGFRYLRWLLDFYGGSTREALHAYNRGIGTVARIRANGGNPANGYADQVLGDRGASPVRRGRGSPSVEPQSGAEAIDELGPGRMR